MLSDNIKNYRKQNNMSQDQLAEKLGVSRQSISLWETGQTQPTIDNIIALSKIFNISSDMLLGTAAAQPDGISASQEETPEKKKQKNLTVIVTVVVVAAVAAVITGILIHNNKNADKNSTQNTTATSSGANSVVAADTTRENAVTKQTEPSTDTQFDLFSYCKDFAISIGTLNGDYCIYQQPATKYGGYENEYFSISYWSDSNMVEFCLHCPLSETYSHNFYLRMRGGYDNKYEYLSSKYYRTDGTSLRCATGYIDPAVFSDNYPISCDEYIGSTDGQDDFMEQSRIGMCDLIHCLKEFVKVENMGCDFSAFDFVNF